MSTSIRPIEVVLDGDPAPAWQQRALSQLRGSPGVDVVEVRLAGAPRRGRVTRIHAALERRLLRLGADALAPVALDGSPTVGSAPRPAAEPAGAGARDGPGALVVWLADAPLPEDESRELLYLRHGGIVEPAERACRRAILGGASSLESELLLRRAVARWSSSAPCRACGRSRSR